MTALDSKANIVTLDAKEYVTLGDVVDQDASEFAAQLSLAPPEYDIRDNPVSTYSMDSWTGGLGIEWGDTREHQGRFNHSDGMETRFSKQLTLGPLIQTLDAAKTVDSTLTRSPIVTCQSKDFFAIGNRIYRNDAGTLYAAFDWGTEAGGADAVVNGMLVYTDSGGTERLFVFANSQRFFYTSDPTASPPTWTRSGAGVIGRNAMEFDRKILVLDGTTNKGEISRATTVGTYTSVVNFKTANTTLINAVEFVDKTGQPCPFFFLADNTGGTLGGVWALDIYTNKARRLPLGRTPKLVAATGELGFGYFPVVWNGALYVPDFASLLKIEDDWSTSDVGPNNDQGLRGRQEGLVSGGWSYLPGGIVKETFGKQGLAPGYGSVNAIVTSQEWLYAILGSGTTYAVAAYTGTGWHFLYTGTSPMAGLHLSTAQSPARLYWIEGQGTTTGTIRYIELPVGSSNPRSDSTYKYAASNTLYSAWIDLGFKELTKILLNLFCDAQDLVDSAETVVVSYQLNGSPTAITGAWTTLGTFNATTNTLTFTTSSVTGMAARTIRFRIVLNRDSTNTKTPKVRSLVLRYIASVPYRAVANFTIDLGASCIHRGAPDVRPSDILAELKTAFNKTSSLVTYQYGGDTARFVKVSTWPIQQHDKADGDRDGTVAVTVFEPVAV